MSQDTYDSQLSLPPDPVGPEFALLDEAQGAAERPELRRVVHVEERARLRVARQKIAN